MKMWCWSVLCWVCLATAALAQQGGPGGGPGPVPSGSIAPLNIGKSVANPGTGNAEGLLPVQAVTGASYAFGSADLQLKTRRSNSGSAMTDTFPASGTLGFTNGTLINVVNTDATASDTITAGSGTNIAGSSTFVLTPGRDVWWTLDTTATPFVWRPIANTASALLAANNLSDVQSASTSRTNLGLGSVATLSTGKSVNNPGTGDLESLLPVVTITGTSQTYGTTQLQQKVRRSNSGSAMSDILPSTLITGMVNGAQIIITNADASANDTLTAGTGTTIPTACGVVPAGKTVHLTYDLTNTAWRDVDNTCPGAIYPNTYTANDPLAAGANNGPMVDLGPLTTGQLLIGQSSGPPVAKSVSGSCTISASGVLSCVTETVGSGSIGTLTGAANFVTCTATCNVTPPAPVAGNQVCVWDKAGTSGVITVNNPGSGTLFSTQTRSGYGTASTGTLTSGGATGDLICMVSYDGTHYDVLSASGTWTNT